MASIANITVFDGAATPVSHTLNAVRVTSENGSVKALWRENLAGLPVEAQVSATMVAKTLTSGVVQVDVTVAVPVMEAVNGANSSGYTAAPKVAFIDTMKVTAFAHPRSTQTSRRLGRQILANLLNNVSTSVAAATSGPVPDAIDSLILPT